MLIRELMQYNVYIPSKNLEILLNLKRYVYYLLKFLFI